MVEKTLILYLLFIFRANLAIVKDLGDRAAQGRACGNLGNTHYLLGNFELAIMFHEEVSEKGTGSCFFFFTSTCRYTQCTKQYREKLSDVLEV